MSALFQKFVQIALLKATPGDLPGQTVVLWISVLLVGASSLAGWSIAYPFADSLLRCIVSLVVPAALFYWALAMKKLQARFIQSFSALCGATSIVYLVALPFMPMFFSATAESDTGTLVIFFVLLLDIWSIVITAHIIKHAFEVAFASAVSLAVAMMILTVIATEMVLPQSSQGVAPIGIEESANSSHGIENKQWSDLV